MAAVALAGTLRTAYAGGIVNPCNEAALRTALGESNYVRFACSGVIYLSNAIVVSTRVVLDGTGRSVVISGGDQTPLFDVSAGGSLTLINLTLANGRRLGMNR